MIEGSTQDHSHRNLELFKGHAMDNVCTVDGWLELRLVVPLEGRVGGGTVVSVGFPLPSLGGLGKPTRRFLPPSRSLTVSNARVGGVFGVCSSGIQALPVGRGKGAGHRCIRVSLVTSRQAQSITLTPWATAAPEERRSWISEWTDCLCTPTHTHPHPHTARAPNPSPLRLLLLCPTRGRVNPVA